MKNSLFRIDTHSVSAAESKAAGYVTLPCLEEMMKRTGQEEQPAAEDAALCRDTDAPAQTEEEAVRRELARLEEKVRQTRREAKEILAEADREAGELKQKAGEQGYADGLKEARREAKESRARAKESLAGALRALKSAEDSLYAQMEEGVLDLSLYIAEQIIRTEISGNGGAYRNMVKTMLTSIRNQSNIVLKVGKEEFEQYFADPKGDLADVLKNSGIKAVQDISLKPGDCLVETEFGYVDAGVVTQLKRLEYSMKQLGTGC